MATSAVITELPEPGHLQEKINAARLESFQDGYSEGVRETKAEHARHLRESQKERLAYHRTWTWFGAIIQAIGFVWLNVTEANFTRGSVSGGAFWGFAGAIFMFTVFHGLKWDHYVEALKRSR